MGERLKEENQDEVLEQALDHLIKVLENEPRDPEWSKNTRDLPLEQKRVYFKRMFESSEFRKKFGCG